MPRSQAGSGSTYPALVAGFAVGFWQVVVPSSGNEGDDTPVFALALATTPVHVAGYAVLGLVELMAR